MVTKRIRSEYMKKFKDPKWETYSKCYEELLKYRLTRRLLEHTHNPWFWGGSDSDSDSSGSPSPPNKNQVEPAVVEDGTEAECKGGREKPPGGTLFTVPESVPKIPLPQEGEVQKDLQTCAADICGAQSPEAIENRAPAEEKEEAEEREEQRASSRGSRQLTPPQTEREREREVPTPQYQDTKSLKPSKTHQRGPRVQPAALQRPREDNKDIRHPFALYGWGERQADMASRKTHNVGPITSTNEIHESALRAKARREVDRQIQAKRAERQRAKSADLNHIRTKAPPEFNPWLTEYMRCFSARSR